MKEMQAPIPSNANQSIKYSGLLAPSIETNSPFLIPRPFMSQLPTLCRSSKNCLYVHVRPSNMRSIWFGRFRTACSSMLSIPFERRSSDIWVGELTVDEETVLFCSLCDEGQRCCSIASQ